MKTQNLLESIVKDTSLSSKETVTQEMLSENKRMLVLERESSNRVGMIRVLGANINYFEKLLPNTLMFSDNAVKTVMDRPNEEDSSSDNHTLLNVYGKERWVNIKRGSDILALYIYPATYVPEGFKLNGLCATVNLYDGVSVYGELKSLTFIAKALTGLTRKQ